MTREPDGLILLKDWVINKLGRKYYLGIVASEENTNRWGAFGYHYGISELPAWDYSIQGVRNNVGDRYGYNFAAAFDLGVWGGAHRWLAWLTSECRAGRYLDLHGVIGSLDGKTQTYWSRENGFKGEPYVSGYGDHTTHTHLEWWRDSVHRSQVEVLADWPGWHPPSPSPSPSPPARPSRSPSAAPRPSESHAKPRSPQPRPSGHPHRGHGTVGPGGALVGILLGGLAWILRRRMQNEDTE